MLSTSEKAGFTKTIAINEKTALVSSSRDIDGLCKNIIRLLDDKALLEAISQNGYDKISEFDWSTSCDQLINLFESSLR